MPKIKTGLLVQCAMRNARGTSKGTKEKSARSSRFSSGCYFMVPLNIPMKTRYNGTTKERTTAYRQGNASSGPLAAKATCKARCLD